MNESNRYGNGGAPEPEGGAWSENPGAFDNESWGQGPWESGGDGGNAGNAGNGGYDGYGGNQPDPYADLGPTGPGPGPQPEYQDYGPQNEYADYGYVDNAGATGHVEPAAAYPASGNGGGGKGKIAGIVIAVLALAGAGIAVGFAGNELGWFGGNDDRASASERRADRDGRGTAEEESGATSADRTETSRRVEGFTAPSNWNHCHGSGDPGDFNLAYAGSDVTSCPFARAVRDSFADYYLDTGNTSGTIDAYSQVTGQSYTMSCTDDGDYVTCRGGNNAVVHIV